MDAMNQLNVSLQQTILTLAANGWSRRRIARELGIHRETVGRHLGLASSKPAISLTGDLALAPAVGRQSLCAPWEEVITQAVQAGLSAQRIYQDLVAGHDFGGGYHSVQRLLASQPVPFVRLEVEPGQEAQVDFGLGAWVVVAGKRKRPHLFRIVLSHSRKAYSEVVWRQTTESFIRCLENAFRFFGGVPATLIVDNLRTAVTRHKGKVEAGVKFAQNNALKGRRFESLAAQNLFLAEWESSVADTRIHGTTRQQVGKVF